MFSNPKTIASLFASSVLVTIAASGQITLTGGDFESYNATSSAQRITEGSDDGVYSFYNTGLVDSNPLIGDTTNSGAFTDGEGTLGFVAYLGDAVGGGGSPIPTGFGFKVNAPTAGTYQLQFDLDVISGNASANFADNTLTLDIIEWNDFGGFGNQQRQVHADERTTDGNFTNGVGNQVAAQTDYNITTITLDSLIQSAGVQGFETVTTSSFDVLGRDNLVIRLVGENIVASDGAIYEQVFIDNVAVVPEVSSFALVGGLFALTSVMLRRRQG